MAIARELIYGSLTLPGNISSTLALLQQMADLATLLTPTLVINDVIA